MAKERNLKTAIISALIGCLIGTLVCILFFWVLSPAPPPETQQNTAAQPAPAQPN
ncbi:MAG: hypothetical protein K1X36_08870 [Pyrinomonadaceae bacterium]|nr:hypothetical protein [Pyrinomonadaceae bacterium]